MSKETDEVKLSLLLATQWLELSEADEAEDASEYDFRRALRIHIRDLAHRCHGSNPFTDDFERLSELSNALRSLRPVYRQIAEVAGDSPFLPSQAAALLSFLRRAVFDVSSAIRVLEQSPLKTLQALL